MHTYRRTTSKILLSLLFYYFLAWIEQSICYSQNDDKLIKAVARTTMKVPFIVDENNLKKINEIIKKRSLEGQSPNKAPSDYGYIKYIVNFSNGYFYETLKFEDILKEENSISRKINDIAIRIEFPRYTIQLSHPDASEVLVASVTPLMWVRLSEEFGLQYQIIGGSKEWVLITEKDILERFQNLTVFNYGTKYIPIVFLVLIVAAPLSLFISPRDYRTKRIFIIKSIVIVILLVIAGYIGYLLSSYLFPKSVFLIGEQIKYYEKIESRRDSFFNGFIAGFFIEISVVGYYHYYMQRKNSTPLL